jgi:hypothetical protein
MSKFHEIDFLFWRKIWNNRGNLRKSGVDKVRLLRKMDKKL